MHAREKWLETRSLGQGNLGGGREEGTKAISGRVNVAHNPNLKGPESIEPLADDLGL